MGFITWAEGLEAQGSRALAFTTALQSLVGVWAAGVSAALIRVQAESRPGLST